MWIQREITKYLKNTVKKRPCVLLTGPRQTGKSSLLEKTFRNYNYVSLDWPQMASEAKESSQYFLEKNKTPIIIDEIQYAPEIFRFLKIEIDKKRKLFGRYLLSGSQKFSLMKGVTESLSGRISILDCYSLSIRELACHKQSKLSTTQVLNWMLKGGYPEIYAQGLNHERFYSDYIATYLERDVRGMINVRDLYTFNKFLNLLALRSGQVLSMNSLSRDVGVSLHTIKSWISILETNSIIYLVRPFYKNYGKRLLKSPKLYFLDTGLLCFLSGIHTKEALQNSSLLGSFFETLCLGQLVRSFSNQGLSRAIYYFRDNHHNEVDFIFSEGNRVHLYECKWKFESGFLPKSLLKIQSLIGKELGMSKIITGSNVYSKIEKNCLVTNLVDL